VLLKASSLILTGVAFDVALRAGLFSIGAEGQLALGSLAGTLVAASLPAGTPAPIALVAALAAAMIAGAAAAVIPALLRARRGVHEIISFFLMNRIVDVLVPWALVAVLGATALRTADVVTGAAVPRLAALLPALTGSIASAASAAFLIAIAAAFGAYTLLERTRVGREMRWVGKNPEACRAEGIDVRLRLLQAALLSGAIAAAAMIAAAPSGKGYDELGLGAGWTGIAVALLGRGRPLGIVLAAILFGTLEQAGLALHAVVPRDSMIVIQAVVILLVAIANSASFAGARSRQGAEPIPPPGAPADRASRPEAKA
jgi:simple sugar transport system permease protein